jgi:CHAD domain-containing protein
MTRELEASRRASMRPTELELKYRVDDPAGAERVLRSERIGDFSGGLHSMRTSQMEDRYVDTPDGALGRAGFAVRLRQSGGDTIVSVKSLARSEGPGGAARREELEGPADRVATPADWPASDARALVLEHAGDAPLVELVTVRQLRRRRQLRSADARVELSLDDVDVVARGRVIERFTESEAELVKGDEAALGALAGLLDAEHGLRRSTSSKLETAMAAVEDEDDGVHRDEEDGHDASAAPSQDDPPMSADPSTTEEVPSAAPAGETARLTAGKTPGVTADDHVAEAGRKVMRFHLARMLDYEAGTRPAADPAHVPMRRGPPPRQRAAWRVFGASFRAGRTRRYRRGLREIAARLGAVRDLDVQLEAADAYRADLPPTEQRALEPLLADWRSRREDARVLLLRELDSDEYRRWVDDYRDFVRTEGALVLPVGPVEPHRVRDTAPSRIWAAYEGVRGYEAVLRWADVQTLHDLRIAGKWLRYTLEFAREALGPEAGLLISRVTALQDHLGLMHDADVAAAMARTFLVEHAGDMSPQESAAIGRYLVDRERTVARQRRGIGGPWRGVAGLRFRRGLGRVIADL